MNKKVRIRESRLERAIARGYKTWDEYQLTVVGSKQEVKARKTKEK